MAAKEESKAWTWPNLHQALTCQLCGSGFVPTATYFDLIQRWQVKVVVPLLCPTCFMTKGPLPKVRGRVKWFNSSKHYGFVVTEKGEEAFFHQKQLVSGTGVRLREGQPVLFHLSFPAKGPEALNLEPMEA